jgi:hypothetical protein
MATGRGVKRLRDLIAQIELLPRGVSRSAKSTGPAVDPVCLKGALPRRARRVSA